VSSLPALRGDTARELYRRTFEAGTPAMAAPIEVSEFKRLSMFTQRHLAKLTDAAKVSLIDPLDHLCGPAQCTVYENGKFVYRDDNHIRRSMIVGNRYDYFDTLLIANGRQFALTSDPSRKAGSIP